jgi:hypothetical protein
MKLYKLSQSHNTGWYTYDSAIVAANSKDAARHILPSPFYFYDDGFWYRYKHQEPGKEATDPSWCHPKYVTVEEVGEAKPDEEYPFDGVLLASYNAGFDESRYLDFRRLRVTVEHHPNPLYKQQAIDTMNKIQQQLKDRGLAELRYHLIEANRQHDLKKTQEYELKVRDYMDEENEDWS